MAQTLKDYNQDLAYQQAAERIGYGQTAPTYQGTYEDQLNGIYDKIANRQPFSYDVNADPLYDMYKDKYIQGGKLAMKDTMGQAAALTGGYGNTYGQQVGQQAYDAYLQNLSAVIPELYGMAYQRYQDEGNNLKDLYNMVGARRDTEYNQWRDAMSDYNTNRGLVQQQEAQDYARLVADDEREYERNRYADETAWNRALQEWEKQLNQSKFDWQVNQQNYENAFNEDERDYSRGQTADKKEYERRMDAKSMIMALIQASGYIPTDEELAAAGITREAADALRNEYLRQIALQGNTGTAYGSSGASSPGSGGSGSSRAASPGSGGGSVYIAGEGNGPGGHVTIETDTGSEDTTPTLGYSYDYGGQHYGDDDIDAVSGAAPTVSTANAAGKLWAATENPTRSAIVAAANAAVNSTGSTKITEDEFKDIMRNLPHTR